MSKNKPVTSLVPQISPIRKSRAKASASKMSEVAALAGVTMITVSRVLNHPEKVAPVTREKVLEAIQKTGYVPNLTAGSLASNKSRIIGAIVPSIDNSIFADTVRGLSETLAAAGYQLLLGQSNYDISVEEQLVATFMGRQVDGLVLTGGVHSALTRQRLLQNPLPVVETWDLPEHPINMVAGFSNQQAGEAVAKYLMGKGYKRLCFAGGPDERSSARLEGMRLALKGKSGISLHVERLASGASFQGGRDVIATLLEKGKLKGKLPQALFLGNDALAAGALMACQSHGITVPQQLAIMGFADLDIAAAMAPALSSVQIPSREMGETAAQMLLAHLGGDNPTVKVRDLGFTLIERAST